jgi:hypothetical protein
LQVAPGVFRTIIMNGINFAGGSGNDDSIRSGFSDRGQVAFFAAFDDNSSAILISNAVIPEPSSVTLLIVALLLAGGFVSLRSSRHRRSMAAH